ncbi:Ubiquitin carboxyl-terminal hydrolase [Handroanthus impetiginosus]|uniref:Ubiquitin carboxyl-terminal hydrolase 26 n=1 Tax=Handroanthus impetiginosus TaxID=429701 RepID=A0A2G9HUQ2_9LAMI|nr:Ubiquitin carboxyl-terminal hydrolase [Handroanthus impetiginosus]
MGNHRPTTRSKNKRTRTDDNAEAASEIFRKILSNGEVTEDDVNQLYMIWKPVCQGCRVNTKDNPNCLCGLIPPPNGSRKSGLWQKTSEIVNSLGPDPSNDLRASCNTPAGLTNLGATCYANSILQCLYMNKSFREGVFSVEPEVLSGEPVLNNLARLFAQLHSSKVAFVDSAPFIQTLELDNGVQQDSHEFLTLLFSLLERCLSQSKVPKARTIVQDLFRGGVSQVTRCSRCGNESEASSKIEDFYELELNVKGLKSLDESLDDYLSIEELQGDNQYYCEVCAARVDATRSIKLRSLPAVVNFQLKRCVFLPNTTTKKKITSPFCFPGELNLARRLSETSQLDLIYDLAAVLIHKGSAVNSGHYTAHIKDDNTGEWWEFDDEHVSNLGRQPFGSTVSIPAAKTAQNEHVDCSSSVKQDVLVERNHVNGNLMQSSEPNSVNHVQTFSSSDAYMLMYVRRHSKIDGKKTAAQCGEHKMEIDGCLISQEIDSPLPSHLLKDVETMNSVYLNSCQQYKSKKESELSCIMKRRQEVRSILSEAPVLSLEKPFFWISTEWLRQWADSVTPPTIDNTSIQCSHGKVPVSKSNHMKRISAEAWTKLYSKYDGGPTLAKGDYCTDCIFDMARNMVRANIYRDQRSLMKELAEAALAGECLDGNLYYISKSWLQQWLRRKNIDLPCDADSGPTASIRCQHGELMPEIAPGAKRVLVPESLWSFIYQTAMTVKPDDSVGCSTFPADSEPCPLCSVQLTEAAFSEDNLREFKLKQRQNHEKLASNKNTALYPDTKYYLLPSSWLSKWRSYINASGKNISAAELDTLNTVVDMLLCEKHCKLLERPPELLWKRELIFQKPAATDGLTLVLEDDWRLLCEEWGGTESKCISARIELEDGVGDNMIGSQKEMPISEEHINASDDVNVKLSRKPIIKTSPEVCEECVGERESSELMKKLSYTNEDICVCLIRGKEPPKSILEASASISDPSRRTSKRSRKATYGNSVNLNVSGSTSIYQLKMMIWESFGVVKENQILHKGSKIIDGEIACLADVNVFPGDILWVTDSKIHENRDIADELSDPNLDAQKAEEGFRGTLLASNISSQAMPEACLN